MNDALFRGRDRLQRSCLAALAEQMFNRALEELDSLQLRDDARGDERPPARRRIARSAGVFYIDVVNAYARTNAGAATYEPMPDSAEYRLVEEDSLPFLRSVGVKVKF